MCDIISGFLHWHIVRCQWNPISCGTHYSGPGLSENTAVITDVGEDQNRRVELWRLPLKWIDHRSRLPVFPPPSCGICKSLHSGFRDSRRSGGGWNNKSRWYSQKRMFNMVAVRHIRFVVTSSCCIREHYFTLSSCWISKSIALVLSDRPTWTFMF